RGAEVRGSVFDEYGPIEDVGVEIFLRRYPPSTIEPGSGLERKVSMKTDGRGRFRTVFNGSSISDGEWIADLRVLPDAGSPLEISSASVLMTTGSSRRLLHILGLLGVLGAVALLLSQVIREAWRALKKKLVHRRAVRARQTAFSETEAIVPIELLGEILESDRDSSDPSNLFILGGMVWDSWRGRPVPEAELRVWVQGTEAEPVIEARSDGVGRFRLPSLPAGRYRLVVMARGFVEGRLEFSLPHRGRLGQFRLDLVAVPLKIRRVYQSMVAAFEGEDLWGRLTPRQIEEVLWAVVRADGEPEHAEKKRSELRLRIEEFSGADEEGGLDGTALLDLMTRLVEESYFGVRDVERGQWLVAREIAMRLTELASPGRSPR
ncbi:MAG: carboxypeptidase-like regulatory domain-containing protein, partial [Bradymonadaceae bacterium]